jgi:hypothetical protein
MACCIVLQLYTGLQIVYGARAHSFCSLNDDLSIKNTLSAAAEDGLGK